MRWLVGFARRIGRREQGSTHIARSRRWITLTSEDAVRILRFLGQRSSARRPEIARATELDHRAVDGVMAALVRQGVVVSRKPHEWALDRAAFQKVSADAQTEFGIAGPIPSPPWSRNG
jgi:hypothetical protein